MQGSVTEVIAESRELSGSSASKKLRRSGKVPGVVYGSDDKPTLIQLDHNQISLALDVESFHSSILELKIGNSNEKSFFGIIRCTPLKDKSTISISNGLMKRKESILMSPCILLEKKILLPLRWLVD